MVRPVQARLFLLLHGVVLQDPAGRIFVVADQTLQDALLSTVASGVDVIRGFTASAKIKNSATTSISGSTEGSTSNGETRAHRRLRVGSPPRLGCYSAL